MVGEASVVMGDGRPDHTGVPITDEGSPRQRSQDVPTGLQMVRQGLQGDEEDPSILWPTVLIHAPVEPSGGTPEEDGISYVWWMRQVF